MISCRIKRGPVAGWIRVMNTGMSGGKQIMIRALSIQTFFPPPVCIMQEHEPQHPAAAHVIRLLHLHRHRITSYPFRSQLKILILRWLLIQRAVSTTLYYLSSSSFCQFFSSTVRKQSLKWFKNLRSRPKIRLRRVKWDLPAFVGF